jgi:thiamine kinase-like enzyme
MMVHYTPNDPDRAILSEITNTIRASLGEWYGHGARLNTAIPKIRTYQYCFMLRYGVSLSATQQKVILVKIRRNPKMDALHQAIQADIHQAMIQEYQTLEFLYSRLHDAKDDFDAIRPLLFMQKYSAILMEEYPSRTLRQLMEAQRSSGANWDSNELKDAARKTGRWLYTFHHHINAAFEKPYTGREILQELQTYAERIEIFSHGRVRAGPILDTFAAKIQNLSIDRSIFSQCHLDMTTNNVLYSDEGKVCIIDMKNRLAPVYADLGLILTYPETSKQQIFSGGTYYSEVLLRKYRAEIVAGYFDRDPGDDVLVRVYSALKVVDKWSMYEELMGRYKGLKRTISIPVAPLVSAYFQRLFRKHLEMIGSSHPGQTIKLDKSPVDTSL